MLIDMIAMDVVHVPVVQIIFMSFVLDCLMATAGTVSMVVSLMYLVFHRLTSMCISW